MISPKGGVGKTTLSLALTAALAERSALVTRRLDLDGDALPPAAGAEDPEAAIDAALAAADVVVADTGRIGSAPTRAAIARADRLLVVATPEAITADAVLRALGTLPVDRVLLVLNRARAHDDAGRAQIAAGFGLGAAGVAIPEDPGLGRPATRAALDRLGAAVERGLV